MMASDSTLNIASREAVILVPSASEAPALQLVPSLNEAWEEVAFFQTQVPEGLWVDRELSRLIPMRAADLPTAGDLVFWDLTGNDSEAHIFGEPGTSVHQWYLSQAVTITQLGRKIRKQLQGSPDELLNDGRVNLFPIVGKEGTLCIVSLDYYEEARRWEAHCDPWDWCHYWLPGTRVFHN